MVRGFYITTFQEIRQVWKPFGDVRNGPAIAVAPCCDPVMLLVLTQVLQGPDCKDLFSDTWCGTRFIQWNYTSVPAEFWPVLEKQLVGNNSSEPNLT